MKFDSTIYVYHHLITELKLSQNLAETCLRLLNGFIIEPMSIRVDPIERTLSFKGSVPESSLLVSSIFVSKESGLSIYAKLKDDPRSSLHINISLSSLVSNSVLVISGNDSLAGIYYDSTKQVGDTIIHTYQFYDLFTLNDIRVMSVQENISLDDLITNVPFTINTLGYMADKETTKTFEATDFKNRASTINGHIKELSFNSLESFLKETSCEPSSINNPIQI